MHILAYKGHVKTSLGLMQKEYGPAFLPAANIRIGVEGTNQRAPYSLADFDAYLERLHKSKGTDESFAILAHGGEGEEPYRYIGHTGIHRIKWPDAVGSTGSIIIDSAYQGGGYGTEAKLLLQYHAFRVLGLRNIKSSMTARG
jgi:RimJ/RimL family protein N-acetyltransferase